MFISENTGRETSEPGSTRPVEKEEDCKPEELELLPLLLDLLINLDHLLDAKLSDIVTDLDSEEDSLLMKLKLLVWVLNLLNPLASQLTTEERIDPKNNSISTNKDSLTILAN